MDDFDWLKKSDDQKPGSQGELGGPSGSPNDQELTEPLQLIKTIREEQIQPRKSPVVRLSGEPFDPFKIISVLILLDIAPELKKLRPDLIPSFFHIRRPVTLIGTGKRAHIKMDDLKTIKPKHGAIVFHQGNFRLYPQEAEVKLNGATVPQEGAALTHGSLIELGSARFVFLVAQV